MNRIKTHTGHTGQKYRLAFTPADHAVQPCPDCGGELIPVADGEALCLGSCPIPIELATREDFVSYDSPSPEPLPNGRTSAMTRSALFHAARTSAEHGTLSRVAITCDQFAECLVAAIHEPGCECAVCEHMATETPDPRHAITEAMLAAAASLETVAALLRSYVPASDF